MRGKFKAKARTWGIGETEKGTREIAVEFDILTEDAEFKSLTWHGYFSEKAFDRTIESLRLCGWMGDDLEHVDNLDANEVELVVEEEEYEGKTYTKVQWVNRVGGLSLKAPLAPDALKSFAAEMKDRIRALEASRGQKKPSGASTNPPEPPPHTDFDIPF